MFLYRFPLHVLMEVWFDCKTLREGNSQMVMGKVISRVKLKCEEIYNFAKNGKNFGNDEVKGLANTLTMLIKCLFEGRALNFWAEEVAAQAKENEGDLDKSFKVINETTLSGTSGTLYAVFNK